MKSYAMEFKNVYPGMKVWVKDANDEPKEGTVTRICYGGNIFVEIEGKNGVHPIVTKTVYKLREDAVSAIAGDISDAIENYKNEITDVKTLLRFAAKHLIDVKSEHQANAARIAFQVRASSLFGIDVDELFYED